MWAVAATTNVSGDYILEYRSRNPIGNSFYNVENSVFDTASLVVFTTTNWDWIDTKTNISYSHDQKANSDEWRCIKITKVEYRGTSFANALANYGAAGAEVCDSDSIYPHAVAVLAGVAVYRSIKITRKYSAWYATTEDGVHAGHGTWT